jgi:methylisocitrate lyase
VGKIARAPFAHARPRQGDFAHPTNRELEEQMSVRKKMRAIMSGKRLVLMPGAYDGLSARIIEAEGFEGLVAGGYAAVGSMLAQADMGQSNMRDYASHYGRICDAVQIPVYVDADTGFGGVNNVRQMIRAFEAAGVAGLFISDQVFPNRCGYLPGKQVVSVEQMLAKVKAALDARTDPDLFIAARTDAAGVENVEAAIERCQLFMEAGADMAKPMGLDTIPEIKRAMREIPGPHMATLSQAAGPKARSLEELDAAGVVAATFPSVALFAAANAVRNTLRLLKSKNSLAPCQEHLIPLDDYYDLVGLKPLLAREEAYDKAAAALVQKRAAE